MAPPRWPGQRTRSRAVSKVEVESQTAASERASSEREPFEARVERGEAWTRRSSCGERGEGFYNLCVGRLDAAPGKMGAWQGSRPGSSGHGHTSNVPKGKGLTRLTGLTGKAGTVYTQDERVSGDPICPTHRRLPRSRRALGSGEVKDRGPGDDHAHNRGETKEDQHDVVRIPSLDERKPPVQALLRIWIRKLEGDGLAFVRGRIAVVHKAEIDEPLFSNRSSSRFQSYHQRGYFCRNTIIGCPRRTTTSCCDPRAVPAGLAATPERSQEDQNRDRGR